MSSEPGQDPTGSPPAGATDPASEAAPAAKPSVIVVVTAGSATGTSTPTPVSDSVPASASASVPASTSASASVPAQPIPEWIPPDTLNEKLSRWSRNAVKTAVTLLGLLILTSFVLWLVPAVVLARSDEYRLAVEHAKADPLLQEELGAPIQTAWSPERYEVKGPGHALLFFEATGPMGWRKVQVEVRGGAVTSYAITW